MTDALKQALEESAKAICRVNGFEWDALFSYTTSPNGGDDESAFYNDAAKAAAIPILRMVVDWHEREAKGLSVKSIIREYRGDHGESLIQAGKSRAHKISANHFRSLLDQLTKGEGT